MENFEEKMAAAVKKSQAELNEKLAQLEQAQKDGVKAEDLEGLTKSLNENKEELVKLIDEQQKHLNELSAKFEKAQTELAKVEKASKDPIAVIVKDNFEAISSVSESKGFSMKFEEGSFIAKDMTLGSNLSGDQPRDYNNDVVRRRPQGFINARDLARTFPITGGTYTYTRSALTSGAVAKQTEGASKAELVYTYTMVDANTDFIAGFARYSRKMRNNLPWLETTLGMDLRDDYTRGENAEAQAILAAQATASTQVITGQNKVEMLIAEIATLADANTMANGIILRPSDYYDILITEKSTGAGYGLPGVVTFDNGVLRINGIPLYLANWIPANKYYVGNWERFSQPVTEGFSFSVSEEDSDNFVKNNITARVEQQTTFAVERVTDIIYGDFTAT